MKFLFFTIAIFFWLNTNISYGQSRTEKYNSIMDRYEYFDASGRLIGYKEYNTIMQQWEYTDVGNSRTSKTDFGEYIKPINTQLINEVLTSKQENYDSNQNIYDRNLKIYENKIKQIADKLREYYNGTEKYDDAAFIYYNYLSEGLESLKSNDGRYYFTNSTLEKAVNILTESYKYTISTLPNNNRLAIQYYNFGVKKHDAGNIQEAIKNYEIAIKLNPQLVEAYENLSYAMLLKEDEIINEMKSLGFEERNTRKYHVLNQKKIDFYKQVKPYLEKALSLKPSDTDIKTTLKNVSSQIKRGEAIANKKLIEESTEKRMINFNGDLTNNGIQKKSSAEMGVTTSSVAMLFIIDTTASTIRWKGSKPTGEHVGTIQIKKGSFIANSEELLNGTVIIDMTSIEVWDKDLTEERKMMLKQHLMGTVEGKETDFFNVNKYPEAVFEVTGFKETESKTILSGNLSLKEKTRSIEFPINIKINGKTLILESKPFTIDRTLWGVNYGSKSVFINLGDHWINDEIQLQFQVKAVRVE